MSARALILFTIAWIQAVIGAPNIILITVDSVGWGDFGRNDPTMLTPNIDRMATEGIFLENHYGTPYPTATRVGLMTGKLAHRTGMDHTISPDSVYGVPLTETLISEAFLNKNYATSMVGVWGLGHARAEFLPTNVYFDTHFGTYFTPLDYFNYTSSRSYHGVTYTDYSGYALYENTIHYPIPEGVYATTLFGNQSVSIIQQYGAADQPFFLYVAFNAIEAPLQAPQSYLDQCSGITDNLNRQTICAMLKAVDDEIGNIENALTAVGVMDNTLIVFLSTSGGDNFYGSSNAPYQGQKGDSWEGGIKSFAFLYGGYLSTVAAVVGKPNPALMHVCDWYPVLAHLIGATATTAIDGINVWNALINPNTTSPRTSFLVAFDNTGFSGGRKGLRYGNYKFMINPTNPLNYPAGQVPTTQNYLYDLAVDPYETNNIASANPTLVTNFTKIINGYGPGLYYRTEIYAPTASNPAKFGGYWNPWLIAATSPTSCTQNWNCETPCSYDGEPYFFFLQLDYQCLLGDNIGVQGAASAWRTSFSSTPCFLTTSVTCACTSQPCQNSGNCTSQGGQPDCACPSGWGGNLCQDNEHLCNSSPCQNGATCANLPNNYTCDCAGGYIGSNCEYTDYCYPKPCENGGTCLNDADSYTCQCPTDYAGTNCQDYMNSCSSAPCQNGGTCANLPNNYTCTCPPDYAGTNCQEDLDQCRSAPCLNGGTCANLPNDYTCTCPPDYAGVNCQDFMNSCGSAPCQNGATCTNLPNNYTCTCASGYGGPDCEDDFDQCRSAPCLNGGTCANLPNDYTCTCPPDYAGTNCQDFMNFCGSSPCLNGGTCANLPNNYTCTCPPDYVGVNCQEDLDQCRSAPCQNGGTCINGIDSYTCQCPTDYAGTNCQDFMNSCGSSPCLNGGTCANLPNNYTCTCASGYGGPDCEDDFDLCRSAPCQNGGTCTNGDNSYTCQCPTGYGGANCEINQNLCSSAPCQNGGTCTNGDNTYTCSCSSEYNGTNCQNDLNTCRSNPCQNSGTCLNGINGFTCICPPGYGGNLCQTRLNACESHPCQNNGVCTNQGTGFYCTCAHGTSGVTCNQITMDLKVKTSDLLFSGTEDHIYAVFTGSLGRSGDVFLRTGFATGSEVSLRINFQANLGTLKVLTLKSKKTGWLSDSWMPEYVLVDWGLVTRRFLFLPFTYVTEDHPASTDVSIPIKVVTSSIRGAGTKDTIIIEFHGEKGKYATELSKGFGEGITVDLEIAGVNVGNIHWILLRSEGFDAWIPEKLIISRFDIPQTFVNKNHQSVDRWSPLELSPA